MERAYRSEEHPPSFTPQYVPIGFEQQLKRKRASEPHNGVSKGGGLTLRGMSH